MPVTLEELGKKVGLAIPDLRRKIAELGFDAKKDQMEDELALLIESELKTIEDKAQVYEKAIEAEEQREIVKSQRKKTAGKLIVPKKKAKEIKVVPAKVVTPDDVIEIPDVIAIKEFSEKTGINPIKIIGDLMKNGIKANINQQIDFETAAIIAADLGIKLKKKRSEVAVEDLMAGNLQAFLKEENEEDLVVRPPIVTVMGHVDHGKSKIIEYIRNIEMLSKEAGGITQHIGAYQVEKNGKKITFLDTPGHEAFTAMRARGAKVTDIAILVVAADEGVKPQTEEALNHAKDAGVPIIVAINKVDKEGANVDRVKAQLSELGLQPEDWGGKVPMVPVSALSGQGIPDLLETILIVAEVENFRSNPNRPAVATVIEAHLDKSLGPVATVVVNTGTLHVGDNIVIGASYGKVKVMKDYFRKNLKEAGPSTPARIAGLSTTPTPGDILEVTTSEIESRGKAQTILQLRKSLAEKRATTMEYILSQIHAGKLKNLNVVLKTDTTGSLEAIKQALAKVKSEEVTIKVIHSGVGAVTESDIMMGKASGGIVVGFHTVPSLIVKRAADREGVQIFTYTIIYQLLDDLKNLLLGLLEPELVTVEIGKAEVRKIFLTEKKEMIIGCRVNEGKLIVKSRLRVVRDSQNVGEGILSSLKKNKDNVHEIGEGQECGIKFNGTVKIEEGDILEAYREETRKRTSVA